MHECVCVCNRSAYLSVHASPVPVYVLIRIRYISMHVFLFPYVSVCLASCVEVHSLSSRRRGVEKQSRRIPNSNSPSEHVLKGQTANPTKLTWLCFFILSICFSNEQKLVNFKLRNSRIIILQINALHCFNTIILGFFIPWCHNSMIPAPPLFTPTSLNRKHFDSCFLGLQINCFLYSFFSLSFLL